MRRNVYLPDEDWKRLRRLAANAGARRGSTMSVSEYLRELISDAAARASKKRPLTVEDTNAYG